MRTFTQHITEIHSPGTVLSFPHKGKTIKGKVVRYDKGGPESPFYVMDHGEYESAKVPAHHIVKEAATDRIAQKALPRPILGRKWNIDPRTIKVKDETKPLKEDAQPQFTPAVKTRLHYQGTINGKTYVVPHSSLNIYKRGDYADPMRHAIIVSQQHVLNNNKNLTPEEIARVHSHIKDIHGGQESADHQQKSEGHMKTLNEWGRTRPQIKSVKNDDVFAHHQTKIAKATLRMHDVGVSIMGGMDKDEARAHLKSQGWSDAKIHQHEHGQDSHKMEESTENAGYRTGDGKRHDTFEAAQHHCDAVHSKTGNIISMVAIPKAHTKTLKEFVSLDEVNLGIGDHKVIKAFLNGTAHSSKKLSTNGKQLDGNWLGGSRIAHHGESDVHLHDLGSKSSLQVHKAIKKHLSYGSSSDVPFHKTHLDEALLGEEVEYKHGHELHPDDQKHVLAAYVHRHTGEHKPRWANEKRPDGSDYKPQHKNDADWLKHTEFAVKKNGRLHQGVRSCRSTPSLPMSEGAEQVKSLHEHIVQYTDPKGNKFYHAYGPMTTEKQKATKFVSHDVAHGAALNRLGRGSRGFWNSEREASHAAEKEYKGWSHEVLKKLAESHLLDQSGRMFKGGYEHNLQHSTDYHTWGNVTHGGNMEAKAARDAKAKEWKAQGHRVTKHMTTNQIFDPEGVSASGHVYVARKHKDTKPMTESIEQINEGSQLKTITSHAGMARWHHNEASADPVGYVSRHHMEHIPSPYAYSPTHVVHQYKGKNVIVKETRHKRYEVHEVPKHVTIHPTDEKALEEFVAHQKSSKSLSEEKKYDIYHKGVYHRSTTQSKSAQEATEKYLKAYPGHKREDVRAFRDNTKSSSSKEMYYEESSHTPLKGHPYHHHSDEQLRFIAKDAEEARKNMQGFDSKAEGKYADQINDAHTVLGYRQRGGMRVPEKTNLDHVHTDPHIGPQKKWGGFSSLKEGVKVIVKEATAMKSFWRTYHRNENANRHTQNTLHLAKHVGTAIEQSTAANHYADLVKHGHNVNYKENSDLHIKLLNRMREQGKGDKG